MNVKKTFKNLYQLLERCQKATFLLIVLIMMVSSVLTQITPKAIGWLTDDILSQSEIYFYKVIPLLFLILIVNIINEFIKILRRILVEDIATKTEKKARSIVLSSLLRAPLSYFKEHMTGNIHGRLNRCLDGTVKLEKLIFMDLAPAVFNSLAAIFVILATLPISLALPTLLVVPIGITVVLCQIHTQKGIRVELLEAKAQMDGSVVELLNGIEVIRMTDSNTLEEQRFLNKSETLRDKEMRHHLQMAKYDCLKFINEIFFTILIIGASAYLAAEGKISVGAVLTSYLCFSQLIKPLQELHRILDELSESLILAEDFFQMAAITPDFSYSSPLSETTDKADSSYSILLSNLHFSYHPEEPVLKNLNLAIEKGAFWGIAGPSGCGKSSLIKAICRLEPCSGSVLISGRAIDSLSRKDLSHLIALVPQTPFLIAGTILQNICYGMEKLPSEEEIKDALFRADLSDFIDSLPNGVYTTISEGGGNLSGGQRQRISLARIFLRKPEILILDEATSALDNTSERFIQNQIELLQKEQNMTILSIAHRLTTLKNCDKIVVLDKGQIVQIGTYQELIETEGIFSDMYHGRLK